MQAQGRLSYGRTLTSVLPRATLQTARSREQEVRRAHCVLHQGLSAAHLHARTHSPPEPCVCQEQHLTFVTMPPLVPPTDTRCIGSSSSNAAQQADQWAVPGGHTHTGVWSEGCAGPTQKQTAQSPAALTLAILVLSSLLLDRVVCVTNKQSRSGQENVPSQRDTVPPGNTLCALDIVSGMSAAGLNSGL